MWALSSAMIGLLHNSIHPTEMETDPLNTVCGCPCGLCKKNGHTQFSHPMECLYQCTVAYHTGWPPRVFSSGTLQYSQLLTGWLSVWLIGWLNNGLTNWVTGWLSHWLTDWLLADWVTEWLSNWLIEWLAEWLSDWMTEWLDGWVTEWISVWLTGSLSDSLIDWLGD